MYKEIHISQANTIKISSGMWSAYWKKVPIQYQVFPNKLNNEYLEKLFVLFNDDTRNPLSSRVSPAKQAELRKLGIKHTSMSVGDVISTRTKKWMVANQGFKELKIR